MSTFSINNQPVFEISKSPELGDTEQNFLDEVDKAKNDYEINQQRKYQFYFKFFRVSANFVALFAMLSLICCIVDFELTTRRVIVECGLEGDEC